MDDLAYVSSTVLRSVSYRQTGPKKNLRGSGVRRREHYLVLPALSIAFPVPPVPHDKSSETGPKISSASPRRGGKALATGGRDLVCPGKWGAKQETSVRPRLSNHYEEVDVKRK